MKENQTPKTSASSRASAKGSTTRGRKRAKRTTEPETAAPKVDDEFIGQVMKTTGPEPAAGSQTKALATRETKAPATKPQTKRERLRELEAIIKPGLASFVAVGQALAEIKQSQLYLVTHHSFEDYCRARWGLSRSHAYRQIEAAQTQEELEPLGVELPNEHAARIARKYKTAMKARVQEGEDPQELLAEYIEMDGAWQRREQRLRESDRQSTEQPDPPPLQPDPPSLEDESNEVSPIGDIDHVLDAFDNHVAPLVDSLSEGDRDKAKELLAARVEEL